MLVMHMCKYSYYLVKFLFSEGIYKLFPNHNNIMVLESLINIKVRSIMSNKFIKYLYLLVVFFKTPPILDTIHIIHKILGQ